MHTFGNNTQGNFVLLVTGGLTPDTGRRKIRSCKYAVFLPLSENPKSLTRNCLIIDLHRRQHDPGVSCVIFFLVSG